MEAAYLGASAHDIDIAKAKANHSQFSSALKNNT
jgi:hypothetical protein